MKLSEIVIGDYAVYRGSHRLLVEITRYCYKGGSALRVKDVDSGFFYQVSPEELSKPTPLEMLALVDKC